MIATSRVQDDHMFSPICPITRMFGKLGYSSQVTPSPCDHRIAGFDRGRLCFVCLQSLFGLAPAVSAAFMFLQGCVDIVDGLG